MTTPTGKTLHELNFLNQIDIQDRDLVLIGDASEPLLSKATTVSNLRVAIGAFAESGNTENLELEIPSWVLEGLKGFWRINILEAVENALAYLIWYYDGESGEWVLHPRSIAETRSTLGISAGPLVMDIYVERDAVTKIAPRSYRRFKVQVITSLEQSDLSAEQSAFTVASLPASFIPNAPAIVSDAEYPYTETFPKYMTYGHSVILKITAPTGQADYISRFEVQRRTHVNGQGAKVGWATLPMHTLTLDASKPAPTSLIYTDDSSAAAPGDVFDYRARVVDTNGTPSAWSANVIYTVQKDTTAPDAPVLSIYPVQLGLHIIIATPTQNSGDLCNDVRGYIIYGRKGTDAYTNILGLNGDGSDRLLTNYETVYKVPDASLALNYQFKAKSVDWSDNMSAFCDPTSATPPAAITMSSVDTTFSQKLAIIDSTATTVSSHTTSISQNAEAIALRAIATDVSTALGLKATITSLISLINLSAEGVTISSDRTAISGTVSTLSGSVSTLAGQVALAVIADGRTISSFVANVSGLRLQGASIEIDGSTVFSSGYNPTDKLAKVGGSYDSAASGNARVKIFESSDIGLRITDDAGADVFRVNVGGTDVGDVIIGASAGQYVKWDKSASKILINGSFTKLGSSSSKIEIDAYDNMPEIRLKGVVDGAVIAKLYEDSGQGALYLTYYIGGSSAKVIPGEIELLTGSIKAKLFANTGGPYLAFNDNKVLGPRGAAVTKPTGGVVVDAEARTAIDALIDRLRVTGGHGAIAD